jgi:hypothetical protein
MTTQTKPVKTIRPDMLLVGLVSEMVRVFADEMAPDGGSHSLKFEAFLYRTLEANCRIKADMAETLMPEPGKRKAKQRLALYKPPRRHK